MQIGYKGFTKDLKCKDFQFEIGKVYEKPEVGKPRLCSADGFHYCNTLKEVFAHYSNSNGNRFCEVEIIGSLEYDGNKGITTSMRIIKEITQDQIRKMERVEKEKLLPENMRLPIVRKLQEKYPVLHVGGSTGLFLHGVRLQRYYSGRSDLDMVAPYFILFEGDEKIKIEYKDAKASGNDFDETFICDSCKVDFRIDNKQRYEIIEFEGFKYKVSTLETIMAAKFKYALNGQKKHKQDCAEICGKKTTVNPVDDIPW